MKKRNADYSLKDVAKRFKPGNPDLIEGTCGNIQFEDVPGLHERVSAPMLLARLCALFSGLKIKVYGQEAYKTTWECVLRHEPTKHVVTFYDWKGAASIGSDVCGKEAPKEFIRDVKALVEALCNDRCPHPYDGCVVGEVA